MNIDTFFDLTTDEYDQSNSTTIDSAHGLIDSIFQLDHTIHTAPNIHHSDTVKQSKQPTKLNSPIDDDKFELAKLPELHLSSTVDCNPHVTGAEKQLIFDSIDIKQLQRKQRNYMSCSPHTQAVHPYIPLLFQIDRQHGPNVCI